MSHEQDYTMVRDEARRFLDAALPPDYLKDLLERPGTFDGRSWRSAVDLGWPAAAAEEGDGGLALGWRGICVLAGEAGRKSASLPLVGSAALAQMLLALAPIHPARHLATALVAGDCHACLAVTQSGESGAAWRPRSSIQDGVLSGATAITPFAASADWALVPAQAAGEFRLLLVALDQPGVRRIVHPSIDNSRAAAALAFDGAAYVETGAGGVAREQLWQVLGLAALGTAFEQISGAESCLDMARAYALERKAFGQQIGRFQAIKGKLADMYIRIELARGCALDALGALEAGDDAWHGLAAAARMAASDAYDVAARENIQTHGAIGVTWEAMPHHHYRRARALAVELGSTVTWRERMLQRCELGLAA